MFKFQKMINRKNKKGQSLAEYGLILALIAVFCIGALSFLGGKIKTMLGDLGNTIGGVQTSAGASP